MSRALVLEIALSNCEGAAVTGRSPNLHRAYPAPVRTVGYGKL